MVALSMMMVGSKWWHFDIMSVYWWHWKRPDPHVNQCQNLNTSARARLKIVMTLLDWKEIHCLWYPYSLISIKTTLAWHKDIWVSQCSPKMPFILKILPLSLSPFKSKILECFYTMERDYLKEANPLTFDRHHRHVIINMNSVHWTPSSTWTSSSK